MNCEWRPETPGEIADHQRRQRELIESKEKHDKKTHAHFPSVLVVCAVIFLIIYFVFNR